MRTRTSCLVMLLLMWGSRAHAEDGAPPRDTAEPASSAPARQQRLHATFDALGLVNGRYSLALEAVTQDHESFVLSGYYLQSELEGPGSFNIHGGSGIRYRTSTEALGTELSYRRYFLQPALDGELVARKATGLFVAPGVGVSRFTTATSPSGTPSGRQSWWYAGPSIDLGGQVTSTWGITVAASVGAHFRAPGSNIDESHMPWTWKVANGSGPRPRFRLEIGWAFL